MTVIYYDSRDVMADMKREDEARRKKALDGITFSHLQAYKKWERKRELAKC